ncbi:hypothetical protein A2774_01350 [Candidatus Roizmanbacteria bacterium RIFCSPHIGHO2_01_FULL_39_12c]|uniref:DNA polymerase III delta N-terminal domain-containing protein n=1 Tax=Candidatus Roizmanbacteria bacterium RIFCSPHIGHO2_01_FULL_39_12c TaxID=1802031 RepID=A0A1F7GDW8_9BACT|nr:MAG: hypothetical protein A2774_01350 [Candidatus Roizmanbacteria bacterium RIFCSPHIGHO2_01_FULL_39_12c]OGK47520.1 MAG: hypothetical protein A2963_01355 [Candidatus Roizmanbacteria bacterium RIFCSPLOWO2_01_FULL_40_13]
MLTIICGEDTVGSRNYYNQLKKEYLIQGIEIREINYQDVVKLSQWLAESRSLFGDKRIFFTSRLNKQFRKDNKLFLQELQKLAKLKDVLVIDWEEISAWELKLKKLGQIKEFKADRTIFKLLGLALPGKRQVFINYLNYLDKTLSENFIFIMLVRHARNLILISQGITPAKVQTWQKYKLEAQASAWKKENLINFYQALFKIEIGMKTSTNPYTVKESLEILACHFL